MVVDRYYTQVGRTLGPREGDDPADVRAHTALPPGYHVGLTDVAGWWLKRPEVCRSLDAAHAHLATLPGPGHAVVARDWKVRGRPGWRELTEWTYGWHEDRWTLTGTRGPILVTDGPK